MAIEAIAAGLPVTLVDVNGVLPLTAAAQFGNLDVFRVLKERGPRSIRLIGDSIVFSAAPAPDITEVDLWLDAVIAAASDTTLRIADLLLTSGMRWAQTGPTGIVGNNRCIIWAWTVATNVSMKATGPKRPLLHEHSAVLMGPELTRSCTRQLNTRTSRSSRGCVRWVHGSTIRRATATAHS